MNRRISCGISSILDITQTWPSLPATWGARRATTGIRELQRQQETFIPIKYKGGLTLSFIASLFPAEQ